MEEITKEQRRLIEDCWSRDFDYDDYVNYSDKCSIFPVSKATYDKIYSEHQLEMKRYFLYKQYDDRVND